MELRDIRLFISDVDGTLLNGHKQVSPATKMAVKGLQSVGIEFALVSHRPLRGLAQLVNELGIQCPCAALNGGVIADRGMTRVWERPIRPTAMQEIVGLVERHGAEPWLYTRTEWYVPQSDTPHVRREADAVGFAPTTFETLGDIPEPIIKVTAMSEQYDRIAACDSDLRDHFRDQLFIGRSMATRLDISHRSANKGDAAISIAGMLGIPLEQVVAAGDGENDIPMFRASGFSIAMGQASAEVHRAASYVTSSNIQDGLAWAIQDVILKHRKSEEQPITKP
jgi:hypothetical protein